MDEASQPQPLSMGPVGGNNSVRNSRGGGGGGGGGYNVQSELLYIKQDAMQVRNAVILLEQEKDSLRKAIRKLKLENGRIKQKVKNLQETVAQLTGTTKENGINGASEADLDYDDLGRDFLLVGGVRDPLSLRYEVAICDANGVEHKSAERYYWYKMAEKFGDNESKTKILQAGTVNAAEEAMKGIKNFNEEEWNKEKLKHWEDGQLLKFEQCFGTGWRKNRDESNKPIFWDGQNEGGKILMKLRQKLKKTLNWQSSSEEEEIGDEFKRLQRFVWRRVDPSKRMLNGRGVVGRGRVAIGPRRTGNGRPGYTASGGVAQRL